MFTDSLSIGSTPAELDALRNPATGRGYCRFGLHCCGVERCKAQRQKLSSSATGEETEVADADEGFRQQMQQEATQEFIERQRQQLLLIVVSGVSPTKGDLEVFEQNQSVVRDGHSVGVTSLQSCYANSTNVAIMLPELFGKGAGA